MGWVGVELNPYEKLQTFADAGLRLAVGDWVVARSERGLQRARVVELSARVLAGSDFPGLLRKATRDDLKMAYRQRLMAAEVLGFSKRKVAERQLEMQLLSCDMTLDGERLVLYFYAEARVDFRQLVKDIAAVYRKRIELYQVNARDRAKKTGALGPCGRECCCTSWLREFSPISVKLAREQTSSLNPQKISGACGRLMCCLRYEYETYLALRAEMPEVGSRVKVPEGEVEVVEINPMRRTLKVRKEEGQVFEVPLGRAMGGSRDRCESCRQPRREGGSE